jgi:hypothetical protein
LAKKNSTQKQKILITLFISLKVAHSAQKAQKKIQLDGSLKS